MIKLRLLSPKKLALLSIILLCGMIFVPAASAHPAEAHPHPAEVNPHPAEVQPHPADINFHNYEINLTPDRIEVVWGILPGPLATEVLWNQVDADLDSEITPDEALAWLEIQQRELRVEIDGQTIPLTLDQLVWPDSFQKLLIGEQPILVFLSSEEIPDLQAGSRFSFRNETPNSLHWFALQVAEGLAFLSPVQRSSYLDLTLTNDTSQPPAEGEWLTSWESGQPEIPGVVTSFGLGDLAEQASAQSNRQQGVIGILEGLILNNETSPVFYLSAFSLALLLGALHALSPGHGKTVVAAYLVGASGKFYHAVALGTVVTLTHTGTVFALGLATLAASSYLMPSNIFPMLEVISGLLILILGIGLLLPRLRDWRKKRTLDQQISTLIPDAGEAAEMGRQRLVLNQPIKEIGPAHSHLPEEGGYIPRGPVVGSPMQAITWRSLLTLGVSGGLVPCPDAIAILLIAVTINRISFGLSLIVAFSLGLAVILIVIGLLIVEGRRLFARLRWFDRAAFIMPVISALIVLSLGATLTVSAAQNIPPGALTFVRKTAPAPVWDQMRILYMDTDGRNRYQLFVTPVVNLKSVQVTEFPEGISGYTISPDLSAVVYAANQTALESAIWLWDLGTDEHTQLLDCAPDFCKAPVWSPDNSWMIYERLPDPANQNALGISSIWWLDPASGESAPIFQDAAFPAYAPRWSAGGEWFSYASINPNQVRFYNLATGESLEIPLDSNPQSVWHPTENIVLYTEYSEIGERYLNKLYRYDLDTGKKTRYFEQDSLDEANPSWSDDGKQIAIVRRTWQDDLAEIGDQLWLLAADGSNPRQITFQQEMIHGQAVWSPDGKALVFHVYLLGEGGAPTAIQVLDLESGEVITIASPGTYPGWIP